DARRAKPRPHKLRTIRQNHQHAIFEVRTNLTQYIAGLIRESCYFSVCPLTIFVVETDLSLPTFLEIVIEEVVGHVEPFWKRWIHSESNLEAVSTTCDRPTLSSDPATERFFLEILLALRRLPGCSN